MGRGIDTTSYNSTLNVSGSALLNSVAFPTLPDRLPILLNVFAVAAWPTTEMSVGDKWLLTLPPVAWECRLQYCIQSLTAQVINGTLNETISATQLISTLKLSAGSHPRTFTYTSHANNTQYDISSDTSLVLSDWLGQSIFTGTATSSFGHLWPEDPWNLITSSNAIQTILLAMNTTTFPQLMDRVAGSLTRSLRTLPYQQPAHQGASYVPLSVVSVNWPWMILPFVGLLGGLAFLGAVMSRGRMKAVGVWKNSALPMFFRGRGMTEGAGDERLERVGDMEDMARRMDVQLGFEGEINLIR